MKWTDIRTQYALLVAMARAAGITQAQIARRGGLSGQSVISKLLGNENDGPSVGTLLRALDGVDKDVVQFFTELVAGQSPSYGRRGAASGDADRLQQLELTLQGIYAAIAQHPTILAARFDRPVPAEPTLRGDVAAIVDDAVARVDARTHRLIRGLGDGHDADPPSHVRTSRTGS